MRCLVQDCPNDTKNVLKVCLEHEAILWARLFENSDQPPSGGLLDEEYTAEVEQGLERIRKYGLKAYALEV